MRIMIALATVLLVFRACLFAQWEVPYSESVDITERGLYVYSEKTSMAFCDSQIFLLSSVYLKDKTASLRLYCVDENLEEAYVHFPEAILRNESDFGRLCMLGVGKAAFVSGGNGLCIYDFEEEETTLVEIDNIDSEISLASFSRGKLAAMFGHKNRSKMEIYSHLGEFEGQLTYKNEVKKGDESKYAFSHMAILPNGDFCLVNEISKKLPNEESENTKGGESKKSPKNTPKPNEKLRPKNSESFAPNLTLEKDKNANIVVEVEEDAKYKASQCQILIFSKKFEFKKKTEIIEGVCLGLIAEGGRIYALVSKPESEILIFDSKLKPVDDKYYSLPKLPAVSTDFPHYTDYFIFAGFQRKILAMFPPSEENENSSIFAWSRDKEEGAHTLALKLAKNHKPLQGAVSEKFAYVLARPSGEAGGFKIFKFNLR